MMNMLSEYTLLIHFFFVHPFNNKTFISAGTGIFLLVCVIFVSLQSSKICCLTW